MKEKTPPSKKKILFHSGHSRQFSGFGKNCKNVLKYLYSTGKYEIVEFANAYRWGDKSLKTVPWKCIGSGPSEASVIIENNQDPIMSRQMSYGLLTIDKVIKQERPDIYIGAEDIWAFTSLVNKPWWNKITCMIWTTLDSLPLFPEAISSAKKIEHYYTWANFARKALNEEGFAHAKCLHGSIETKNFYKLSDEKRQQLRDKSSIGEDEFIIGFVFRNQLRKSVPNLLDGYKKFVNKNPKAKAKLLLHTGWHEGWDIPRLLKEKSIKEDCILTTYHCSECGNYSVSAFNGKSKDCHFCKTKSSLKTISVSSAIKESQLNEIYNLMDVYCHPFTSGGQEIPIQEAKLTELVTLCTNYSCGEDMCIPEACSLPLSWSEYREGQTQFIKASTSPSSIASQLTKVLKMPKQKRLNLGERARQFVINNYSAETIGKELEEIVDKMPRTTFDFEFEESNFNPSYEPNKDLDGTEWVMDAYKGILNLDLPPQDQNIILWTKKLEESKNKQLILKELRDFSKQEKKKEKKKSLENLIGEEGKDKRIAVVVNEGAYETLLATALLKNIHDQNPDKNIYFITNPRYFPILYGNPYIHKKIPYFDDSQNPAVLEGAGEHKGYFDIAYILPKLNGHINLHHNGKA